jgi:hypothetical protein
MFFLSGRLRQECSGYVEMCEGGEGSKCSVGKVVGRWYLFTYAQWGTTVALSLECEVPYLGVATHS